MDDWAAPPGWFHDAACALLIDGVLVAAVEEERPTRRKHGGKFPHAAIEACLAEAGLSLDEIDLVAYGEEGGTGPYRDPRISTARIAELLAQRFGGESLEPKIRLVEHHLGHAMSAYGPSGFDEALVFTFDGFGDGCSGYVIGARGWELEVLDAIPVSQSLGAFYGAPLPALGWRMHDEYKMMGLAPYGEPAKILAELRATYALLPDGAFRVDAERLAACVAQVPPRGRGEPFTAAHRDLAAAFQAALEEIVFHVLSHFREATGLRRLCLAGGCAQNSTLNGKLLASGLFDEVFVQPAAHDAGIAVGAAYFAGAVEGVIERGDRLRHVFLGRSLPPPDDVAARLDRWRALVEVEACGDAVIARTAEVLAGGAVIGWVQGRAEFGPRALGHRSILADPRPAENKDRVNGMVKKREAFRPFAPAVTAEDLPTYFEAPAGADCAFMTFVVPVREAHRARLGAVTHADGTARVQAVAREVDPRFWSLLRAFGERAGVPILLNTSFNNDREPIVDTVDDAVTCFLTTGLDLLVVGEHLVRKRAGAPDALLGLTARLRPEVFLGIGRAGDAPVRVLLTRGRPADEVSAELAAALSDDRAGRAPVGELLAHLDPAGRARIAAELGALWALRLVELTPS